MGASSEDAEPDNEMNEEERRIVSAYQQSFDDENVDTDLIMQLLNVICQKSEKGETLYVLTSYV